MLWPKRHVGYCILRFHKCLVTWNCQTILEDEIPTPHGWGATYNSSSDKRFFQGVRIPNDPVRGFQCQTVFLNQTNIVRDVQRYRTHDSSWKVSKCTGQYFAVADPIIQWYKRLRCSQPLCSSLSRHCPGPCQRMGCCSSKT